MPAPCAMQKIENGSRPSPSGKEETVGPHLGPGCEKSEEEEGEPSLADGQMLSVAPRESSGGEKCQQLPRLGPGEVKCAECPRSEVCNSVQHLESVRLVLSRGCRRG